jgi:hypothetical protein
MTNSPPHELQHPRAWLLGGLAAVLLRGLPDLRYPIGVDQGIYSIVGQGLLHGQLPYRDFWDLKPPGIYYIYALIVKIFGPVMWCVGVVDLLWLLAISVCIFYFARSYVGTQAATLAMVFNASRHSRIGYNSAAQAESFLMLCAFAAWFLLREGDHPTVPPRDLTASPPLESRQGWSLFRCFMAGLVLGVAVWLKYNAVIFFPFVLLLPFVEFHESGQESLGMRMTISWRDWLLRMSFVACGLALAIAAVLVHFSASGAWPAMKEAHFELMLRYGATGFQWRSDYLAHALRMTQFYIGFWTEVMVLLSLIIALWRREIASLVPTLSLALAGFLCVATQGRFHIYHFETCHPFLSIFWGYMCVKAWKGSCFLRGVFAARRWALAGALTWILLASVVFAFLAEECVRAVQQYVFFADWLKDPDVSYRNYYPQLSLEKLSDQLHIIDFLKQNSKPEDAVYVWGMAPLINLLSRRASPTRFFYNYPLISTWGLEKWRVEVVRALESKRPRYIIVERDDANPMFTGNIMTSQQYLRLGQYPGLSSFLRDNYEPLLNNTDFEVYALARCGWRVSKR